MSRGGGNVASSSGTGGGEGVRITTWNGTWLSVKNLVYLNIIQIRHTCLFFFHSFTLL